MYAFFSSISADRLTGKRTFSFLPHRTRSRLVELLAHMQEAKFTKVHWLIYILAKSCTIPRVIASWDEATSIHALSVLNFLDCL